jgi:hypothetical protein
MANQFTPPKPEEHIKAVKQYAKVFLGTSPTGSENNDERFDFRAEGLVKRYAEANNITLKEAIEDIEERMNVKETEKGRVAVQGPFNIRNDSHYNKLETPIRGKVMDFAYPKFNEAKSNRTEIDKKLNEAEAKIRDAIGALGPNDVLIQILPRDYIKDLTLADQNYVRNALVKIYEEELRNAGKDEKDLILVDPGTDKNAGDVKSSLFTIEKGVDAISLMQDVAKGGRTPVLSNNSANREQPGNGAASLIPRRYGPGYMGQATVDECVARQMYNPFMGTGKTQKKFLADMKTELSKYNMSQKNLDVMPTQKSLGVITQDDKEVHGRGKNDYPAMKISFGDSPDASNNAQAKAFLEFAKTKGIKSRWGAFFQKEDGTNPNCVYIENVSMTGADEYYKAIEDCLEEFNNNTAKENENETQNSTSEIERVTSLLGEIAQKDTTKITQKEGSSKINIDLAEEDMFPAAYALQKAGYTVKVPEDMQKGFDEYIKNQDAKKSNTQSPADKLTQITNKTEEKRKPEEETKQTTKIQELEERRNINNTRPSGGRGYNN